MCSGEFDGKALELEAPIQISRQDLKSIIKKSDASTVIALDFPFSVPKSFLNFWVKTDCKVSFAQNMLDLWEAANRLRKTNQHIIDWCKEFIKLRKDTNQDPIEPKRAGDEHYTESLSPLNLRMSLMTIQGMRLLHDLWDECSCQVQPFNCPRRVGPKLLEVMPGSTLKALGLPYKIYKQGLTAYSDRRKIISALGNYNEVTLTNFSSYRDLCMFSDDCLDSIVSALTAALWLADVENELFIHPDAEELKLAVYEGWLYSMSRSSRNNKRTSK